MAYVIRPSFSGTQKPVTSFHFVNTKTAKG